MTMPFTHKKDEVRATGTLEARTPGDQAVQVLLYVIIALVALACVLPFIYVVAGSFATERELTERPFFLIPQDVSLNAYQYILKQGDVFRGLKNSVIVTVIGTLINMFVSCTIAYPLSRPYLKGRNGFINMVIVTMLFTGGMVPAYGGQCAASGQHLLGTLAAHGDERLQHDHHQELLPGYPHGAGGGRHH